MTPDTAASELKYRDPARARALAAALAQLSRQAGRRVALMHVCGSHEQAIARFGLRSMLPVDLELLMGPGCPVCVTDAAEVDEGVELARRGIVVASYGDMVRVPGSAGSLADAQAEGGRVRVVYGAAEAVELARRVRDEVVFFATGFETTAVTSAAAVLGGTPPNFSLLSAHKYIPPALEVVARLPGTRIEGYLAAGHAATITGFGIFEAFAARHRVPVVVAGFEPLDILAALLRLLELVVARRPAVVNMYPRCVTRDGNRRAQQRLWDVFRTEPGRWRGIADVPDGNLALRPEWRGLDARRRFALPVERVAAPAASVLADRCRCGDILAALATPGDCPLFDHECLPDSPVGACMVSSEGACRIWHEYGGRPQLGGAS